MPNQRSFYEILTDAVNYFTEHGFDSQESLIYWVGELRKAATATLVPEHKIDEMLRSALNTIYTRLVEKGGIAQFHPGVQRFTLERIKPQLRAELDRRIMASANLIKLNRVEAIEKTLRRFAGWATSIPKGGTDAADKVDVKKDVRKSLAQLPFVERRVLIDQGHKLNAAINETLAKDGGALAVVWHSHWRQTNYDYREDHKARDGKVYALRGNWALEKGLMKAGPAGYYDEITAVGEEVFCRCYATYIYSFGKLPDDMLTQKGKDELARVRGEIAA